MNLLVNVLHNLHIIITHASHVMKEKSQFDLQLVDPDYSRSGRDCKHSLPHPLLTLLEFSLNVDRGFFVVLQVTRSQL